MAGTEIDGTVTRRSAVVETIPEINWIHRRSHMIGTENERSILPTFYNGPKMRTVGYMYAYIGFVSVEVADDPSYDPDSADGHEPLSGPSDRKSGPMNELNCSA